VIYFTSTPKSLPRRGVLAFIVCAAVLTLLWRLIYIRLFTSSNLLRRVLIVGAGRAGETIVKVISEQKPSIFNVIGLIDDDPEKLGKQVGGFEVMGNSHSLIKKIQENQISDLILAISGEMKGYMYRAILSAQEMGVTLTPMPKVYEDILGRVPIFLLETEWIVRSFVEKTDTGTLYELARRLLDIIGGLQDL